MIETLTLQATPELLKAIDKQLRKGETFGELVDRLLDREARRKSADRERRLQSLTRKIAYREQVIECEKRNLSQLRTELEEMLATEGIEP